MLFGREDNTLLWFFIAFVVIYLASRTRDEELAIDAEEVFAQQAGFGRRRV